MINIKKLPKVELHIHLDGSVRVNTIKELSSLKNVKKMVTADKKCKDLNNYLEKFNLPLTIMQNAINLERIAYECAIDLYNDGVIYAEIRFAPMKHTNKNLTSEQVLTSVLKGLKKVKNIDINVILCMIRGDTKENNKEVINLAYKYLNKGVCGIDLAGAEALYKTSDYKDLFTIATNLNIPFTIHAGEADGISSIESAIEFKTTRLGHGINSIKNKQTIQKIIENNILLELCPTSNIQTNIFKNYKEYPAKNLYDLGVKICFNTDNRTVSNTTLTKEYKYMIKYNNFSINDIINTNLYAINNSFASNDIKEKVTQTLKRYQK